MKLPSNTGLRIIVHAPETGYNLFGTVVKHCNDNSIHVKLSGLLPEYIESNLLVVRPTETTGRLEPLSQHATVSINGYIILYDKEKLVLRGTATVD